ncbi:hypothetical protein [Desertimonas flava]|jgi:hypothetical protein|uniref:hypothetical protein n=1 Tax=Desertimonas flava TaxID=2064846 RepID=UPI000E3555AD|nr:hypothetical protein [Desertimonas flava]
MAGLPADAAMRGTARTALRAATASPALLGTVLAGLSLGIDWYRPPDWNVPGRALDARVFIVGAIVLGVVATLGRRHARLAATAAAGSMLVAFGLAVRQMSLSLVSPTALVVVAATVAAFAVARGAAGRSAPAPSDRSG